MRTQIIVRTILLATLLPTAVSTYAQPASNRYTFLNQKIK